MAEKSECFLITFANGETLRIHGKSRGDISRILNQPSQVVEFETEKKFGFLELDKQTQV